MFSGTEITIFHLAVHKNEHFFGLAMATLPDASSKPTFIYVRRTKFIENRATAAGPPAKAAPFWPRFPSFLDSRVRPNGEKLRGSKARFRRLCQAFGTQKMDG